MNKNTGAMSSLLSTLHHHIQSPSPSSPTLHAQVIKSGFKPTTNISIKLLILHLKSGSLDYARKMFDEMPDPTVSAYSYMISGYFKRNDVTQCLGLVRELKFSDEKPYWFALSMVLKLAAASRLSGVVREVHAQIVKSCLEFDEVLFTALIDSYAKNGRLEYARRVFEGLSIRNFVCSTALITGYMNCGLVGHAEEVFEKTDEKDVVVFNAMIEGYSKRLETCEKALQVYKKMQSLNFHPTISTFASVVGACSLLSELDFGLQVHCQLSKFSAFYHVKSGSAIVDMYCKCGRVEDARTMFDQMLEKNVVTWTSMIDGYGKNGSPHEALRLFYEMTRKTPLTPTYVTFLSALSACGHAGLVSDGKDIFASMEREFSMKPRMEHYACMVDLLGRVGSLSEAFDFVKQMPEKPNADVWAALLGASRLHGGVEIAGIAANEVFKLSQNRRPGAYVALSNAYAAAGKWGRVCDVREMMKERGVSKDSGRSWTGTD